MPTNKEVDCNEILDSIDEFISSFDRNWNILYISKKTAIDFGLRQSDLIGKNFWQMFPRFAGTDFEKVCNQVMDKRISQVLEWKTIYVKPSIREFTVSPSAQGITVHGKDITERKKAEELLSEQAKKTKDILESIGDGFFALDNDLNFIYANKLIASIYGLDPKKLIGRNLWDFFPADKGSIFEEKYREVLRTGISTRFDYKSRIVEEWFEYNVFPSSDGILVFVRDITVRKKLQEKLELYTDNLEKLVEERTKQLKDSERLATIGATAGMVGHDIRNPLQAIVSELYLAKQNMDEAPDGKGKQDTIDSINFIQEQVDYINKIVADLQDYARNTLPTSRDVNIKDLIDSTFSALTIPSNIVAKCSMQGNPQLKSDPDYLRRIITNLSTNAIQAMPNGGKLTLNVKQNMRLVEISVSDTGNGIPKEIQERIFTPLFTTKSKGQGFGLAVVKKFVEQLGGKITFESQEGKGTTFTVRLPPPQSAKR